jgi:hypothetical protein
LGSGAPVRVVDRGFDLLARGFELPGSLQVGDGRRALVKLDECLAEVLATVTVFGGAVIVVVTVVVEADAASVRVGWAEPASRVPPTTPPASRSSAASATGSGDLRRDGAMTRVGCSEPIVATPGSVAASLSRSKRPVERLRSRSR